MNTRLLQLEQRVKELDSMAEEVGELAARLTRSLMAQPELSKKGHAWFRGAREFLVQQRSSAVTEFDDCYIHKEVHPLSGPQPIRARGDIERYLSSGTNMSDGPSADEDDYEEFSKFFRKARSLVDAVVEEVKSRELPVVSQLSFAVSADEFRTAEEILSHSKNDEALTRASGVIARVALERHLFTVVDARSIKIDLQPRKKKAEAQDVLNALAKHFVISAVQKSELESLFKVGNLCAHPKESIAGGDVARLVSRGRELCSVIL